MISRIETIVLAASGHVVRHAQARSDNLLLSAALFVVLVATAALGQYVFYVADISPAVIWPPSGIALAAVLILGYRMWIPIACAFLVSALISPSHPTFTLILASTVTQTAAPLLGAFALKRLGFDNSFNTIRSALIFGATAFLLATVVPTVLVGVQALSGALSDTLYVSWTRSWTGRLLSMLVLTPLIIAWLPWRSLSFQSVREKLEMALVFGVLTGSIYGLFWTTLAQSFSFLLIAILLAVLFWVVLRLNIRAMVLALFLVAAFGMTGPLFVPQSSTTPPNQRLFATELFIILLAPIFLTSAALMKERRETSKSLESHIARLETAMQRLSSEDEAKSEFMAMLAHELRNPLASILSSVELLKIGDMPRDESTKLLATVDNRSRTMGKLLDDLLDVSRISQKKLELEKKTVLLCRLVERSVETAQSIIRARNHTLSLTLPDEPIPVEADPVRLEQIFVNLLTNAAKYTEERGVIALTVERDADTAVVRVRDSGVGIPTHLLGRIFEPFFQVAGVKRSGGMGIGLSLTRQLVELHGGTIKAKSQGEGHGSEFTVRLPALRQRVPLTVDRKVLQGKRALRSAKHALNILVVDDNRTAADALGKLLSLRGHAVTVVYNGVDALAEAQRLRPHAVLLDVGLPDMSGYEVAQELRRERLPVFLVAVTGYGQAEDKERAFAAGFDRHLTKPVGLKELEAALRKVRADIAKIDYPQGVLNLSANEQKLKTA